MFVRVVGINDLSGTNQYVTLYDVLFNIEIMYFGYVGLPALRNM